MKRFPLVCLDRKIRSNTDRFTYELNDDQFVQSGSVVKVPFRNNIEYGWVTGFTDKKDFSLKKIIKVVKKESYNEMEFDLVFKWMSEFYNASLNDVLINAYPFSLELFDKSELTQMTGKKIYIKDSKRNSVFKSGKIKELISDIIKGNNDVDLLLGRYGIRTLASVKNIDIAVFYEKQFNNLKKDYQVEKELSDDTAIACDQYINFCRTHHDKPFILHCQDDEKRALFYAKCISNTINSGKQVLIITPESAGSQRMLAYLKKYFNIPFFHSGLNEFQKAGMWSLLLENKINVVMGTRSSVFLPFKNLGLIIINESQEKSLRQDSRFRFSSTNVALKRADINSSSVIFGTSAPDIELYTHFKNGDYGYHRLDEIKKYNNRIEIIDIRRDPLYRTTRCLSREFVEKIKENIGRNEKCLILINKKGYESIVICQECGSSIKCPECQLTCKFDKKKNLLRCANCSTTQEMKDVCSVCGGFKFTSFGSGIDKVEEELNKIFPNAGLMKIDKESVNDKIKTEEIKRRLKNNDYDIVLGTSKILNISDINVSLAGILSFDAVLNIPDYSINESLYQFIRNVITYCKRSTLNFKIIIQTYVPDHFILKAVIKDDYDLFYEEEMKLRRLPTYPPYIKIIKCVFNSNNKKEIADTAENFKLLLTRNLNDNEIIQGPNPCYHEKRGSMYRWQVVIKTNCLEKTMKNLKELKNKIFNKKVSLVFDVEPSTLI